MSSQKQLFVLSFLLILSVVASQGTDGKTVFLPRSSNRIVKTTRLLCLCSPGKRGYAPEAASLLRRGISATLESRRRYIDAGLSSQEIIRNEIRRLKIIFVQCAAKYGHESCVNADASLRGKGKLNYCLYDRETGRNLFPADRRGIEFATIVECERIRQYRSSPGQRGKTGEPGSGGGSGGEGNDPNKSGDSSGSSGSGETPQASPAPDTAPSTSSGASKSPNKPTQTNNPLGLPSLESIPQPSQKPANEGCVAVEHLKGYVLQHREHLLRDVLCANGFCATPHHAIIVQGQKTCMKELCGSGKWKCTQSRKLVNNLKISANTKAMVGDITVTPYDIRFPVFAIWAVQIIEDVLRIVGMAGKIAAAIMVSMHVWLWNNGRGKDVNKTL